MDIRFQTQATLEINYMKSDFPWIKDVQWGRNTHISYSTKLYKGLLYKTIEYTQSPFSADKLMLPFFLKLHNSHGSKILGNTKDRTKVKEELRKVKRHKTLSYGANLTRVTSPPRHKTLSYESQPH